MTQYLIKFIFYTGGVVGLLLIAYVIAKNCLQGGALTLKKKINNLEIEETLNISPRKTLHIVRAFDEKFLIASDSNNTTLLAKLNSDGEIAQEINTEYNSEFNELIKEAPETTNQTKQNSVIQSMLSKLNH